MTARVKCPQCGETSGNDWSQCGGFCPMLGSPHYSPPAAETAPRQEARSLEKLPDEDLRVLAVAQALCAEIGDDWSNGSFFCLEHGDTPESNRRHYLDLARAAIRALGCVV